jgi:hypothetical protein
MVIDHHVKHTAHLQVGSRDGSRTLARPDAIDHIMLQSKKLRKGGNHHGAVSVFNGPDDQAFCLLYQPKNLFKKKQFTSKLKAVLRI